MRQTKEKSSLRKATCVPADTHPTETNRAAAFGRSWAKGCTFPPQFILGELHFIAKNSILHQQLEAQMVSLELQEKLSPANGTRSQG